MMMIREFYKEREGMHNEIHWNYSVDNDFVYGNTAQKVYDISPVSVISAISLFMRHDLEVVHGDG
jgi:hypothetical protein